MVVGTAMPWKVRNKVSERMKFVTRLEMGERMTDLCREFGISRTTGHRLWKRFKERGPDAIFDDARRPRGNPLKTPDHVLELIYEARRAHPTWGAPTLKYHLEETHPGVRFPVHSTIHKWLNREGLIHKRRRRRNASPTPRGDLKQSSAPNDIWTVDYKGQFRTSDRRYCYPLTICDHFSRYLLGCEGMERISGEQSKAVFTELFRQHGLPMRIRSDNGAPFASTGLCGLTKLSAWWMRLGIEPERIEPGHPEQNGRHERLHLTLKQDTIRPAAKNILKQQERFDEFVRCYNDVRPHQALGMQRPAKVYVNSPRAFPEKLDDIEYPLHDDSRRVQKNGHIHLWRRNHSCHISCSLAGYRVGLRQIDAKNWIVTFMNLDLGIINTETEKLERFQSNRRKPGSPPASSDQDTAKPHTQKV